MLAGNFILFMIVLPINLKQLRAALVFGNINLALKPARERTKKEDGLES